MGTDQICPTYLLNTNDFVLQSFQRRLAMEKIWVVRSNNGEYIETFIEKSIVALGWCPDDNLKGMDLAGIKQILCELYPTKQKSIPTWAGMINNFVNKIKINDYVLTYDPSSRLYYIGKILDDYSYNSNIKETPQIRKVKWYKEQISRDLLSNDTKNSLGSTLTVFRLNSEQEKEILDLLDKKQKKTKDLNTIREENNENSMMLIENSKETLKDAIQSLSSDEMEELFKEILIAMGYIANRTKKGADRGIDIFASKDGLGLEEPRIFVEVKHRKGQMGSQEIRAFTGGRKTNDKCLYVSTGGFTKDAKYEAERSNVPLKLVDIDDLVNLITLHYDNFSAEGKILLPLKKVYLPLN